MAGIEISFTTSSKQDIPVQNYQMHEIHCWRNIALCKSCREPVPKSKMEEHNEEYHALVECKCKQKIEKSCLELHEVSIQYLVMS